MGGFHLCISNLSFLGGFDLNRSVFSVPTPYFLLHLPGKSPLGFIPMISSSITLSDVCLRLCVFMFMQLFLGNRQRVFMSLCILQCL